eukprot:COSAG01_NODE_60584_length_294_cov_0.533333_1_plen_54_part_01
MLATNLAHVEQDGKGMCAFRLCMLARVLFAFAGVPMPLASSAEVGPRQQCQALC